MSFGHPRCPSILRVDAFPGLKIETWGTRRKHLFTGEGKLRSFVNLYLNDEDVRYLPEKERSEVSANDTLSIIPSIAGGCRSL
jgi:molybdopterin converting factor small subunit